MASSSEPADWWRAIGAASRRLASAGWRAPTRSPSPASGRAPSPSATTASRWHPALTWLDARGAPHARRLAGGPVAGYAPLKVARWLRLTGGAPSLSGRDPLGHIL